MTWAMERRVIVFLIVGAVLAAIAAVFFIALFYRAPSCTDGVQNGSEQGPDCGGSCPYLCGASLEAPTVLFTQALGNGAGRTDVIALVENKNRAAAAKDVPYTLAVYGYDQTLIQRVTGTLELAPGATVPIFVPGIASGQAAPGAAFLSIASSSVKWYALARDPRVVPAVSDVALSGASTSPRITAELANPDVSPMTNVKVIALVRDAAGNAIAATQTVVPAIPPQASAAATFTWNAPFPGAAVSFEVLPLIPLP